MSTVRTAAIDCGTNTIRLLIADVETATGRLVDVARRLEIVRLGHGVDRTGRLDPEAVERTLAALRGYQELIATHGVAPDRVRFVATSATRDAANSADFTAGVERIIGRPPEVISGDEEAALSFAGAVGTLDDVTGPVLVVDIGGGSTESILGAADGTAEAAFSADLGSVRLTERHLRSDPPTADEIATASAEADAWIDRTVAAVDLSRVRTVVGVAGTATSITAIALGLTHYQPDRVHGTRLPLETVRSVCDEVLHQTRAERRASGLLAPGRADVIGAGALIWSRLLTRTAEAVRASGSPLGEARTSEHDLLDGIAAAVARAASGRPGLS